MGRHIIGSIFDFFFNCLSTTANTKSLYVYHKMAGNISLYIDFHWNITSDNTFI